MFRFCLPAVLLLLTLPISGQGAVCTEAGAVGELYEDTATAWPSCSGGLLLAPTEYQQLTDDIAALESAQNSSGSTSNAVALSDIDPSEIALAFGGGFGLVTVSFMAGFAVRFLLSMIKY